MPTAAPLPDSGWRLRATTANTPSTENSKVRKLVFALAISLFGLTAIGASADPYPSKPIRFVIGFPAGNGIDVASRVVLDDIRERTGAVIVVDNKPGALGAIGIQAVATAAADGYTLMPSSSATHSSGPNLLRALESLKPIDNFARVGLMTRFDVGVVVSSKSPFKSVKDLVAEGVKRPEQLNYGYGSGTGQVAAAAFASITGIKAEPIPYKGQPAAVADLLGGRVNFVASDLGTIMGFVQSGVLRPIALLSDRRSSILPDIPTMKELGYADASLIGWLGIDGPKGLPDDVKQWWKEQLTISLAKPAVKDRLITVGMEASPLFGEDFSTFVTTQGKRWATEVKKAGIQME
jgi:tripartite-type tricarboxylate transporter receptor subunit TctC